MTQPQELFTAPTYRITRLGLEIKGTLTFDEWVEIGRRIVSLGNATRWALGDWLLYGEGRGNYGERYSQGLQNETQGSYGGLANAVSVAKKFPPESSRRRENLSWSHHAEVSTCEPEVADTWLNTAEANNWSVKDLRPL